MSERLWEVHGAVLRTLHHEVKTAPGGIVGLADATGRSRQGVINVLNPGRTQDAPSLELFLEAVEYARATRTLNVMAGNISHCVVPVEASDARPHSDLEAFLQCSKEFGDVLTEGGADLTDARFDAAERQRMLAELDEAIASAVRFRQWLRGA